MDKMVERLRRRALRENRFDDASDEVIQRRLKVYEAETKPILDYYSADKIVRVEATMSQIRVLSELIKVLVPLKEEMDRERERSQSPRAGETVSSTSAAAAATVANNQAGAGVPEAVGAR